MDTIAEYLATKPKDQQRILRRIGTIIEQVVPDAEPCIAYGIPTYKVGGKIMISYAGWKKHYSLYPVTAALVEELQTTLKRADYEVEKATIRFPYESSMPTHFLQAVMRRRAEETRAKAKKR